MAISNAKNKTGFKRNFKEVKKTIVKKNRTSSNHIKLEASQILEKNLQCSVVHA